MAKKPTSKKVNKSTAFKPVFAKGGGKNMGGKKC
jgi:hypothetical protein